MLHRRYVIAAAAMAATLTATLTATAGAALASGLDITPPPGFTVKHTSPEGGNATTDEVASSADPDAGCLVGFAPAQASRGLDQAQIDAAADEPSYLDTVKASLSGVYDVDKVEPFAMQGAHGVAITGSPKAAQGAVRSLLVVVETPKGRVNVACVGPTPHFDALRPGFEAVARGVTLPR